MKFFLYIATWAGIMGGLRAFAEVAEKGGSKDSKRRMAKKIQNFDPVKMLSEWPDICTAVFNAVFGRRHFTFRCFRRACYASLFFVVIMTAVWGIILRPEEFRFFYGSSPAFRLSTIYTSIILTLFLNLLPDYLSLLKTRYIIEKMKYDRSLLKIFVLLFSDFFITFIIAFFASIIFMQSSAWSMGHEDYFDIMKKILSSMIERDGIFLGTFIFVKIFLLTYFPVVTLITPTLLPFLPTSIMSVFFYATFFTSIWVLIFAISCVVLNVAIYSGVTARVNRLKKLYDIRNRPYFSISLIMMQIITFIFIILAPFLLHSQNPSTLPLPQCSIIDAWKPPPNQNLYASLNEI